MVRQKNRDHSLRTINQKLNLSAGDAWDQKMLHEKYLKDLEAIKYREAGLNKRKKCKKHQSNTLSPKRRPSPESFDFRCKQRPNTAASEKKPPFLENYRTDRRMAGGGEADETEKFFDIIRDTVTDVVQRKLAEIVGAHFQNILQRVEDITQKLKKTENNFNGLCTELNNKLNHYGEEHSRHFRYICMKLEYDKIFYQHMNGYLRQDHVNNGLYGCGQNLAQDLINLGPPPCQLQQCPCTSRATDTTTARATPVTVEQAGSSLDNRTGRSARQTPDSRRNYAGGDNSVLEKMSGQENQRTAHISIGNSDVGLKELLATIKQYYPNQENQGKDQKRSGRKSHEFGANIGENDSTEVSSRANSEDFTSTTPDIMNVKVQQFVR